MSQPARSSDQREEFTTRALMGIVPGLVLAVVSALLFIYSSTAYYALAAIVGLLGLAAIGYGVFQLLQINKVSEFGVECPYCRNRNRLTAAPTRDFRCVACQREVPIGSNGAVLQVWEVRCGYCNELNYYNERSIGLICESCAREIPISVSDDVAARSTTRSYSYVEDEGKYDLILTEVGPHREEMILCVQHMLALNRNQVKEIMDVSPVALLIGVPKKKAELMGREIQEKGGKAESRPHVAQS